VGQNLGHPSYRAPSGGVTWKTFWPPADLELWHTEEGQAAAPFSTVSQWWGHLPNYYDGEEYGGSKRTEFLRFIELPTIVRHPFELALNLHPDETDDRQLLLTNGWSIQDAHQVAGDFPTYRQYIQGACGEFSVAKPGYVTSRSGWFSDRTACYLAAGKPVLVQETGFSAFLPTGRGVRSFSTLEQAAEGAADILRHYPRHCQAAREIAREYFAADRVLSKLMREAGL
jgi:hypothetical protein